MQLGKGHTAGERWSQDTTPGSPSPEEHVWGTTLKCGPRGLVPYTGVTRQLHKVNVLKASPNSINQIVPGDDFYSGFNLETLSYVNVLRYNSETPRAIDNASWCPSSQKELM